MMPHHAPPPMATSVVRSRRPRRYFHLWTLMIGLVLQLHLGYLLLVDRVNPVPALGQLVQIPVEVLQAQDRSTQFVVRLVDGAQRILEFPASAAWFAPTHTPLQADEWDDLPGCMGYVLGTPVRWVRDERLRIWELHCGPIHRVYAEFKAAYAATVHDAQRAMEWHGGIILLLTLLVLALESRVMNRGGRA